MVLDMAKNEPLAGENNPKYSGEGLENIFFKKDFPGICILSCIAAFWKTNPEKNLLGWNYS